MCLLRRPNPDSFTSPSPTEWPSSLGVDYHVRFLFPVSLRKPNSMVVTRLLTERMTPLGGHSPLSQMRKEAPRAGQGWKTQMPTGARWDPECPPGRGGDRGPQRAGVHLGPTVARLGPVLVLCKVSLVGGWIFCGDAWVAQSVGHPTSAQVMISRSVGPSPASGSVLTAQSLEPVSDSVSPSLSAPPLLTLCFCLKNKSTLKKFEKTNKRDNCTCRLVGMTCSV